MAYDDNEGWKLEAHGHMLETDEARILAGLKARCLVHHPDAQNIMEVVFYEATPDGEFVKIGQGGGMFGAGYTWVMSTELRILCKFPPPPEGGERKTASSIKAKYPLGPSIFIDDNPCDDDQF